MKQLLSGKQAKYLMRFGKKALHGIGRAVHHAGAVPILSAAAGVEHGVRENERAARDGPGSKSKLRSLAFGAGRIAGSALTGFGAGAVATSLGNGYQGLGKRMVKAIKLRRRLVGRAGATSLASGIALRQALSKRRQQQR